MGGAPGGQALLGQRLRSGHPAQTPRPLGGREQSEAKEALIGGQGAQTDLSQTASDWAVNRFTACPFNSLSAYNGGWHGAAGGRLFRLCPGKVRARISAGKRRGGAGLAEPAPCPPSPIPLPAGPAPGPTSGRMKLCGLFLNRWDGQSAPREGPRAGCTQGPRPSAPGAKVPPTPALLPCKRLKNATPGATERLVPVVPLNSGVRTRSSPSPRVWALRGEAPASPAHAPPTRIT